MQTKPLKLGHLETCPACWPQDLSQPIQSIGTFCYIEAYESAERQEKDTEADCEAWKLLLEQMKEADAAQASNLGQVLAPAIASRF